MRSGGSLQIKDQSFPLLQKISAAFMKHLKIMKAGRYQRPKLLCPMTPNGCLLLKQAYMLELLREE